jgi:hypothetical protein
VTFLTAPEKDEVLLSFYRKVRPAAYGWKKVLDRFPAEKQEQGQLPKEIGLMLAGTVMVYSALFSTGFFIYGNTLGGIIGAVIAIACSVVIIRAWKTLH